MVAGDPAELETYFASGNITFSSATSSDVLDGSIECTMTVPVVPGAVTWSGPEIMDDLDRAGVAVRRR